MNSRLLNVYSQLEERKLEGLLVSSPANISYLTGFLSRDAYLLVCRKGNVYFTDSRYSEEAGNSLKPSFRLRECNGPVFFKSLAQTALRLKIKRLGFEERYLPFAEFARIKDHLGVRCEMVPGFGIVEHKRQVKEPAEISRIRQGMRITAVAFEHIKRFITCGMRESEVAAEFERFIRSRGCNSSAFETIVASGPNSSQPHHLSGCRRIKAGEPVLIDFGVDYRGYKTDLTRVLFLGKIDILVRRVYDIVRKAQELAIKRVRPGAEMAAIDKVVREYITRKGYGRYFTHNLGHGLGLEVHEDPRISGNEASALKPGMVFTIEPGIYLAGRFGIRIEDMILVTNKGCEVLSGTVDQ
ncbi:MAG: Xaa-Pro peptidase family protein [Candidatus Omnitrophica bacterium]|nr:Xaa-Pro peptidase family protein [Candidatus Omnitrophota bacterium]